MELKRELGKKGIYFTLIAIILLGITIVTYSTTYNYTLQQKASVEETRIETMNRFLIEIENDMKNAIYISGFRALIGLEDKISNTGTFVNNTQDAWTDLFLYGIIDGDNSTVMINNTFLDWIQKINLQANLVGINLTINVTNTQIEQKESWTVTATVNSTLIITDIKQSVNWTQEKSLNANIDIEGFEDPWYAVYTSNNIIKRINKTIYEGNYTNSTDETNLRDHVAKTYYTNFSGAPNFLMRFENNFSANEFGIESIVDKNEISMYYSCPTETSSVDSVYWQCDTNITVYQITNWSGFRIDNETDLMNVTRLEHYMVEDHII